MRKQTAPAISNEPDLPASPMTSIQLSRSQSLPNLSMHHYAKQTRTSLFHDKPAAPQPTTYISNTTNKFYIDNDDDDEDTVSSSIDNSCYWTSTTCSSTPSSIMSVDDESSMLFTKQDIKPLSSCGTRSKPTSLLSLMLHQQQHQQPSQSFKESTSSLVNHSLRRCDRFGRLNEWFASANVWQVLCHFCIIPTLTHTNTRSLHNAKYF